MRPVRVLLVVVVATLPAVGAVAGQDGVPLYTTEDLDRMFGPAPRQPSEPVDKSGPADWGWVEQFLDREYARIDADRQHDLQRASLEPTRTRGEYDDWSFSGSPYWYPGFGYGYYPGYAYGSYSGYRGRMGWRSSSSAYGTHREAFSHANQGGHGQRPAQGHNGHNSNQGGHRRR